MTKKEIDVIRRTVSILDSVDYHRYSQGKVETYLEYAAGDWTDERKLIAPILFPKFLEQILRFRLGETIGTQEASADGRDIPDYIPIDTRTHPFVFDCKGMDTFDLSKWYSQIKRYIEAQDLTYGILVNMRDLDVYTVESEEDLESFNFVELYKDFKENPASILVKENTKRFLRFVEHFSYTPLMMEGKFKKVVVAKPWTGAETLNIDLLTRRLHYIVECIYEDAGRRREELSSLAEVDPERAKAIAQEIEIIASEIERGRKIEEASLEAFGEILNASPQSLWGRALNIFFYRVGYFTMTRLLLARTWEDIGFIDQSLYDGGLATLYENFNRQIGRVLKYAFGLAAERYKWLFNVDNNYTWYEPSDGTLIEVLYELSNFYLGKLDRDVLGTIYEEYIDKVDKKQKGQYYTPREIVEFIWDRVGFVKDEDFFYYKEGKRQPRPIFDPVTGSGGFLVEAARRIRGDTKLNYADFNDLLDIRTAMLTGIFGSEISPFPYYITEVNLLIQLTPVIKGMMDMQRNFRGKGTPALGVVPSDALSLYNPAQLTLEREEYDFDQTRDLLPLESQKKVVFHKIKRSLDGKFSYCCANPPYVGEKGNKELFRATLERFSYWREFYQGKMDYLYFFIILGLSKLEEGGKLGFITTAYWPTADGASVLRKYILKNARIKEMIFFEDVKIFEYARGQHNMVFILEKCSSEQERAENRIKIVQVLARHHEIPGNTIRERLKFLTEHIQKHINESEWEDEYIRVFWSGVKQGELTEKTWNLLRGGEADRILEKIQQTGVPLSDVCNINQGLVSGAPKVSESNIRLLPQDVILHYNIKVGDGIFVLSREELESLRLSENEMALIKPYHKSTDIHKYYTEEYHQFVIYITKDTNIDKCPRIKAHLEKFRPILENKREFKEGKLPWFSLHWARDQKIFEGEKIVTPNFARQNSFVYTCKSFYTEFDSYFITSKDTTLEFLKYITAILNSKVADFWCSYNTKRKGEKGLVREYNTGSMSQIPIRRINLDHPEEVKIHDHLVELVSNIIEMKKSLASYNRLFPKARLTRLQDSDPLPEISDEEIVKAFDSSSLRIIRTHPQVKYQPENPQHFFMKSIKEAEDGQSLTITSKDKQKITLTAREALLAYLQRILPNYIGREWGQIINQVLIPTQPDLFDKRREEILSEATNLRQKIKALQQEIDTIIFNLYELNEEEQKVIMGVV
ncbi:MAG: hypothetical protein DDT26_01074 [Dehalococcoidia bacterium]|nr:hypothetical protein [Chloroflexota bacterium]